LPEGKRKYFENPNPASYNPKLEQFDIQGRATLQISQGLTLHFRLELSCRQDRISGCVSVKPRTAARAAKGLVSSKALTSVGDGSMKAWKKIAIGVGVLILLVVIVSVTVYQSGNGRTWPRW